MNRPAFGGHPCYAVEYNFQGDQRGWFCWLNQRGDMTKIRVNNYNRSDFGGPDKPLKWCIELYSVAKMKWERASEFSELEFSNPRDAFKHAGELCSRGQFVLLPTYIPAASPTFDDSGKEVAKLTIWMLHFDAEWNGFEQIASIIDDAFFPILKDEPEDQTRARVLKLYERGYAEILKIYEQGLRMS